VINFARGIKPMKIKLESWLLLKLISYQDYFMTLTLRKIKTSLYARKASIYKAQKYKIPACAMS
jgi:hypothetical protein